LGYVPLAETACELMFQVIADRAEKAAVIVTTNLPFSEWSQVIPNPRLCKALIDRLTDQAHIIITGCHVAAWTENSAVMGRCCPLE
jgi:DNA replication protein DnaC